MSANLNNISIAYSSLDEAFPDVDPGHVPYGEFVVVQIRLSKEKTKGGVILTQESRLTDQSNMQVARVVAIGPAAFHSRTTGEPWPGGAWYKIGDFVRAPRYGGDRWSVKHENVTPEEVRGNLVVPRRTSIDNVEFVLLKDLDVRASVTDPLNVVAYI